MVFLDMPASLGQLVVADGLATSFALAMGALVAGVVELLAVLVFGGALPLAVRPGRLIAANVC